MTPVLIPMGDWAAALAAGHLPAWLVTALAWLHAIAVPAVYALAAVNLVLLALWFVQAIWCEPRQ